MKRSSRFLIGGLLVAVLALAWWFLTPATPTIPLTPPETTRADYEPLVPMTLGSVDVFASVADTPAKRQLGLSRTTSLPSDVVKLFVFPIENLWSFWMKEMQYSIDIIWLDARGAIVHIEQSVAPETYPTSFTPAKPAMFVIETNAGFVAVQNLKVGDVVNLPPVQAVD